ncbi:type VI secretion system-associated protein VasI [Photobacterium damselae]|uniref:type VI secretion system-associated protein VasI n=1 Tax=Photobacterium damselae TaxID=38293 RepID=UPI003B66B828
MIKQVLIVGLLSHVSISAVASVNSDEVMVQAQHCRSIEANLPRLECFDRVFSTPIKTVPLTKNSVVMPQSWQWATDSEKNRTTAVGFYANKGDSVTEGERYWLTAPAINKHFAKGKAPVLMLSCIENISRVELVFPEPIQESRVSVSIPGIPVVTQNWISDDTGYLLRSGRGIPAIEAMKSMLTAPQLILRSNAKDVDGLAFDTTDLRSVIEPMRKACRW